MKTIAITFAMAAALAVAGSASGEEVFIHFEEMAPADPVAGLGTLHPNLDIQSLDPAGNLVVIQTFDDTVRVYKAPNRRGTAWGGWNTNDGLEDEFGQLVDAHNPNFNPDDRANGFADVYCSWHSYTDVWCPQEFSATFNNRRVSRFEMLMADYGDWNPSVNINHEVYLRGYDQGFVVAEYGIEYTTDAVSTPVWADWVHTASGFNPRASADACDSHEAGLGHAHLEINAPPDSQGFDRVELVVVNGPDPNTAFDSLRIDFVNLIDVKPCSCPNPLNFGNPGGDLPTAVLGTDQFDVTDVDPNTCTLEGVPMLRYGYEDVSRPYIGSLATIYSCVSASSDDKCTEGAKCSDCRDGYMDLTLKFPKADVAAAIGDPPNGSSVIVELACELYNGDLFVGHDIIKVIN